MPFATWLEQCREIDILISSTAAETHLQTKDPAAAEFVFEMVDWLRKLQYDGTDRQCRGRLLAVLRESDGPVPAALLDAAWADESQRARSLASLVADGLAESLPGGSYALPR